MACRNPKDKGSSYERKICNLLSFWVSNLERKDIFWRSAMSGGRATVRRKKGESLGNQAADVSMIDPLGQLLLTLFAIECKHYKSLGVESLFFKCKGELSNFWRAIYKEAYSYGKAPMLIAKQNNKPDIVVLDKQGSHIVFSGAVISTVIVPTLDMYVFSLSQLLMRPFDEIRKCNAKTKIRRRLSYFDNRGFASDRQIKG